MEVKIIKQVLNAAGRIISQEQIMEKKIESPVKFRDIEIVVHKVTGISPEEFYSKTRKREVLTARQLCHYIAREYTDDSLAAIGKYFGEKDHATVLNSNRVISDLIDTNDKSVTDLVDQASLMITNEYL